MEDLLARQEEPDLNMRGSSAYFKAKIEDMHIKLIGRQLVSCISVALSALIIRSPEEWHAATIRYYSQFT